jgi:hypothetical protein
MSFVSHNVCSILPSEALASLQDTRFLYLKRYVGHSTCDWFYNNLLKVLHFFRTYCLNAPSCIVRFLLNVRQQRGKSFFVNGEVLFTLKFFKLCTGPLHNFQY